MSSSDERFVRLIKEARQQLEAERRRRTEPVAIIGMACRFPGGASSPGELWDLLANRVDATSDVPADRWDADALYDPDPAAPGRCYVKRGAFIERVDQFDPEFFGISPREAVDLDPQQRLLLEVTWEALERAGIPLQTLRGSATGVFVGLSLDDYASRSMGSGDLARIDAYSVLGNARSVAAGRIAYVLDLHGPVMQLDTACSSSLVALHLACQSLRAGECDLAVVGGVNVMSSPEAMVALCRLSALARDGRCKTFDARADGYGRGEGCGVIVLKRLSDAEHAGDPIDAVIRGSAVNHDGHSNGLTAPNGIAQEAVIRAALANGGVAPSSVGYVEAHGTGTLLGDPIEVMALGRVYGAGRSPLTPLYVGSLKTNLGHLEAAAGVAGVIKAALCLSRARIAPHLHVEHPNPHIPWNDLAIQVTTEMTDWPRDPSVNVAGVSSFGISGTNAHVLLERAPRSERALSAAAPSSSQRSFELLVLSAKNDAALNDLAARHSAHLAAHPEAALAAIAYSVATTREMMPRRAAIVVRDRATLTTALDAVARGETPPGVVRGESLALRGKAAWLFTGGGAQQLNMGRTLHSEWPAFRDALDAAFAALDPHLGRPLRTVMWADAGTEEAKLLDQTDYAQPALFAIEWALTALWRSWGVAPNLVAGHSSGEITAACVAGVLTLEDAARLICVRGRLMQASTPGGCMVAIAATEHDVAAAIERSGGSVSIAAINGASVVVSGTTTAAMAVADHFAALGVDTRRLAVSIASHSPLMDPMLDPFLAALTSMSFRRPAIPFVSNVSGAVAGDEVASASYWVRHVRESVRFAQGVSALVAQGATTFIEIGPKATLLPLVAALPSAENALMLPSLRAGIGESEAALQALGSWVAHGGSVDWKGVFHRPGPRVALPTYPWQRSRYWSGPRRPAQRSTATEHWLLGRRVESAVADATYEKTLSGSELGGLPHRRLGKQVLISEVALLEIARAATDAYHHDFAGTVAEMRVETTLIIHDDSPITLQTVVTGKGALVEVFSRTAQGSEQWVLHAQARTGTRTGIEPPRLDRAGARRRCVERLDVASLLVEGRGAQSIKSLWVGDREAVAELKSVFSNEDEDKRPPELLDAAVKAMSCAFAEVDVVALRFEDVQLHGGGGGSATVWMRLLERTVAGEVVGAMTIADHSGSAIATLGRVTLGRPKAEVVDERVTVVPPLYRLDWPTSGTVDQVATLTGRWWVASVGHRPDAERLLGELSDRGARAELVETEALSHAPAAEHLVAFWDLESADTAITSACEALALVQAATKLDHPPRLWWLTRRAVAAVTGEDVRPASSTIWGLGRTVIHQHPELGCTLIDLDNARDAASVLATELAAVKGEHQIAVRGGRRHVARVSRIAQSTALRAAEGRLAVPSGTILIVGGLDGLGLAVAEHLARRGARHLVLAGRSGVQHSGASQAVAAIEQLGCRVTVATLDVSDSSAVARLVASVPAPHPLRGIVHAAGAFDDGALSEQTARRFVAVMQAKVIGSWNLHVATEHLDLEMFIVFSSVAGALGGLGQSGYAAANTFLDSLAAHRRARGLPGLSLAWGPWAERGAAASMDASMTARLARQGIGMLTPHVGLALFDAALAQPYPQQIAANFDLGTMARGFHADVPRVWSALLRPASTIDIEELNGFAIELSSHSEAERARMAREVVIAELARVLMLPDGKGLSTRDALQSFGLDSLNGVELRNALRRTTGAVLPATLNLGRATVETIAAALVSACLVRLNAAADGARHARAALGECLSRLGAPKIRLICFHDAGGSAPMFAPFVELEAVGVEVHALSHSRARQPDADWALLFLEEAVHYIRRVSHEPYVLFGHSLGALVAWRVAEELQSRGIAAPRLFIASGSRAPRPPDGKALDREIEAEFRRVFPGESERTDRLKSDFVADLRLLQAFPSRAQVPALGIPIAAYRGKDDHFVSETEMRSWAHRTSSGFTLTDLPGDHFYLGQQTSLRALLTALAESLSRQ